MELYGRKSKSIPQKIWIISAESLVLLLSYYLLFEGGIARVGGIIGVDFSEGIFVRRLIIFLFSCVVYIRMWITIAYLIRRRIPLEEALSVPLAFSLS